MVTDIAHEADRLPVIIRISGAGGSAEDRRTMDRLLELETSVVWVSAPRRRCIVEDR